MSNITSKSFFFWYIRDFSRYLRDYLKYYFYYQIYQTRKHALYEFLQLILILSISFYTIIINFILIFSKSKQSFNIVIFFFCKFFKKCIVVFDKINWFATQWKTILFDKLNIANWDFFKTIIFDKNRKFFFKM